MRGSICVRSGFFLNLMRPSRSLVFVRYVTCARRGGGALRMDCISLALVDSSALHQKSCARSHRLLPPVESAVYAYLRTYVSMYTTRLHMYVHDLYCKIARRSSF